MDDIGRWRRQPLVDPRQSAQTANTYPGANVRAAAAFARRTGRRFGPARHCGLARCGQGGPRQLNTTTGLWSIVGLHHLGAVRDLAASAGVVASAGDDTTVRLWHGATGKWLVDLLGHEGAVDAVALQVGDGKAQLGSTALQLLAKGATVATGSVDFSVRLWALQPTPNGQIGVINGKTFGLGGPWPQDLALSPGTQPALGAQAGVGQLWASAGGSAFAYSLSAANFAQKSQSTPRLLATPSNRFCRPPMANA